MIYRLQKKFIRICIISFLCVFTAIFTTVLSFVYSNAVSESDKLADFIMENNEKFPAFPQTSTSSSHTPVSHKGIGVEAPFTTRFFLVRFDHNGKCTSTDLTSIASISDTEAKEYGYEALEEKQERGWIQRYRFKSVTSSSGTSIVFINNDHFAKTVKLILTSAFFILVLGGGIFITIVFILSKRAVKPVAESYEKQKQFITNANHELKTPLTLMLTNLDIVESEFGKNEWLDDIRFEGQKMTELINRMVYLARMDEERTELPKIAFNFSEMVAEMADVFQPLALQKHLSLVTDITPNIFYLGDDVSIRQLISALLENAMKYCDANGFVTIHLSGGQHPLLTIDNHYASVDKLDLDSIFERFYRADKARTSGSGFGVGLSVAKAIVEKHEGKIWAENINHNIIRFCVKL